MDTLDVMEPEEKGCGRPRCQEARAAILSATLALLSEQGLCSLSMEAIARRAGVGKQTIYRWWPGKADVVLEAMAERQDQTPPLPDQGSLQADLEAFVLQAAENAAAWTAPHLRCLMVEAQRDEAFRERFLEKHLHRRRREARSLFRRAMARGEILTGSEADLDLLLDMLFGALWHRLLTSREPLSAADAATLAQRIARAAGSHGGG